MKPHSINYVDEPPRGYELAQPTLGEAFVVTGLGLIGQLTVQLLIAHGCRVLGIDMDSAKCDLARTFGAQTVDLSKGEDPVEVAKVFSGGGGRSEARASISVALALVGLSSFEYLIDGLVLVKTPGNLNIIGAVPIEE